MRDRSAMPREELLALVDEQDRIIEEQAARIAYLEKEVAQACSGDVDREAARVVPSFVKASRKPRESRPRKKRLKAFTRPRGEPTDRIEHAIDRCPDCGRPLPAGWQHRVREVIDIAPAVVRVTHHAMMRHRCGVCRKAFTAAPDLSEEVTGQSRFGVGVTSLVAYMDTTCRMTTGTIQEFLKSVYGLHVSSGEIVAMLHRTAQIGRDAYDAILEQVRTGAAVHADETGAREDGVNGYEWSFSTADARYYLRSPSRSGQVARDVLGKDFDGPLVSDFYSAYHWYAGPHQYCWTHLLRDLRDLREKNPNNSSVADWVANIRSVYDEAKAYRDESPFRRERQRHAFEKRLMAIVEPYRPTGLPQHVLAERIARRIRGLFVFVQRPEVPPDNNAAERAIRPYVVMRKISGGTRSQRGSSTQSVLLSLFATWRATGRDQLQACREILTKPAARSPG